MDTKTIDWKNLTDEQIAVLQSQVVNRQDEDDPYGNGIVQRAVQQAVAETERRMGGYVGSSAKHIAFTRLTEGLSEKAKARLLEQLKDKPVEEVVYLADNDTYREMFRDSAEHFATKQYTNDKGNGLDDKGDDKLTTATADVEAYKKEMKEMMGVEFTDAQATKNLALLKNVSEVPI